MPTNEPEAARAPGATTIAPGVLVTTARLAALGVKGVSAVASVPGGVNRFFRRGSGEGVRIEVEDDAVSVDLFLILTKDTNVRDVSRKVQAEVARAIEDIVGMQVTRIDVHIEDIDYTQP
ncbi:MAG: Asp23/Gls24 family envelope stress response protein [Anaerolineales bacterium]|nr:Asp23/Gls24 family envelope stress response protein [Anaerolineales bacterium]